MGNAKGSRIILFMCVTVLILLGVVGSWFIFDCELNEPYIMQRHIQENLPKIGKNKTGENFVDTSRPLFKIEYFTNTGSDFSPQDISFKGLENFDFKIYDDLQLDGCFFSFDSYTNESGKQLGRFALRTLYVYLEDANQLIELINSENILIIKKAKITFTNLDQEKSVQNVNLGEIVLKTNKERADKEYQTKNHSEQPEDWNFWKAYGFLKEKGAI